MRRGRAPAGCEEPQLAYSMAEDAEPLAGDEFGPEFDEYDDVDRGRDRPARG